MKAKSSFTRRRTTRSGAAAYMAENKGKLLSAIATFAVFFIATTMGCARTSHDLKESAVSLEQIISREYKISDIVHGYDSPDAIPDRVDDWVLCITANIESGKWNIGDWTIHADHDAESIRVRSTHLIHKRIDELLLGVREMQVMQAHALKSQIRDSRIPNAALDVGP